MPNSIKYSLSSETQTLRKGNFYIGVGDVGKGPSSVSEFYNGYEVPENGYVIHLNKASPGTVIYAALNDAELISLVNKIEGSTYTTINEVMEWSATDPDVLIVNKQYQTIISDGLVLILDAGYLPSYPKVGSSWYSVGSSSNNGTLTNGPVFNPSGWIEFDGVDDHVSISSPGSLPNYAITFLAKWISTISQGRLFGTNASGTYTIRGPSNVNFHYNPLGGSPSSVSLSSNTNVGLNRWTQVTVTVNSVDTSVRIYINGLLKNSNSLLPSVNLRDTIFVGSGPSSQGLFSNCVFSSFYVYNRPLSLEEISRNYYQSSIITDGLIFAVDAGNLVSYEPDTTTAYQLIGSVSSGSLNNGVTFSSNSGGTWGFDGTDDFINFGNSAPVNFIYTNSFSLESWINPNALSGFKHIIGKTFGNYRLAQNGNAISFRLDSNKMTFQSSAILIIGKWTHVIATWEPSTFTGRIYIDGILAATSTNTSINWTNTTANFQIGNSPGEDYYFNGNIALGRVYNKALTTDEIFNNFSAQRSRFGI